MYRKHDDTAADGPSPSRFKASGPRGRHLAAHALVAVWAVLALLAASAQQTLPVARWPAVHLFLLGAATAAIVVWSEHFTVATLHSPRPDRRWSNTRQMRQNTPDAWAFKGIANQYSQQPLQVKAGERARFWVVVAGPGDGIAFHIVGTVFDTVYKEGAYLLKPNQAGGAQVLDPAPAQGGFVETAFPEGGHYAFVDHDMRHAEAGAHGMVEVTG